jgi:hypothetical protein
MACVLLLTGQQSLAGISAISLHIKMTVMNLLQNPASFIDALLNFIQQIAPEI